MSFFINRQPSWLVKALNRSPNDDSGVPNFIPDTIAPSVDIFGWEALQRMRTGSFTGAVGVESVQPAISVGADPDWVGILGKTVVPPGVALRIMTGLHIQHNDNAASRIMWFGLLDREGGSTGIPTETGPATAIQNDTPLVATRVFFLRPLETFVGRIRALGAAKTLSIFYTWIDLKEGEYISGQIF